MANATEMLYGEKKRLPSSTARMWYRSKAKAAFESARVSRSAGAAAGLRLRGRSETATKGPGGWADSAPGPVGVVSSVAGGKPGAQPAVARRAIGTSNWTALDMGVMGFSSSVRTLGGRWGFPERWAFLLAPPPRIWALGRSPGCAKLLAPR